MSRKIDSSDAKNMAYKYACVIAFYEIVAKYNNVKIIENESLKEAKEKYNSLSETDRSNLFTSACGGINCILSMEPRIFEMGSDEREISIQPNSNEDLRDIIITRRSIKWQIGISVKNDNFVLKQPEISKDLDFGKEWFGIPCSKNYFEEIKPYFEELESLNKKGEKWKTVKGKEKRFYTPILTSFMEEIKKEYSENGSKFTKKLVNYLFGTKDLYRITDSKWYTKVIPFNINGTLHKRTQYVEASDKTEILKLPTRIVELDFKDDSKTTLDMIMDNGWQISFQVLSSNDKVEPSLKLDIKVTGRPTSLRTFELFNN